jgi:hypothetical protein
MRFYLAAIDLTPISLKVLESASQMVIHSGILEQLEQFFIGSVVTAVLHKAEIPVTVVPTDGK